MRKNKGITLVALVVTIVVLLILAGVSINLVLGNNGIIAKAKDAETKSAEASQNDLKGMNGLVSEMEGALAGNGSTGSGSGNGGAGGSGADTKVPAEATAETAPYFPDNTFTKKEGTIDTGLVIQDASGNEYVWVVVPRTTAVYATTGLGKTTFTDADYTSIENDLKEYTKTYRGSTSFITDTWYADDKNEGWLSETEYKTLKNSMLKSVYENGGFYVGRYEAGIGTNRTSIEAQVNGKYPVPTTAPVTKADAYPYTYVTRTQAQNLASNVKSGTKTSSLMFGVQWDLVLAFMHNKGNIEDSTLTSNSTTIGNYYNSTFDLNRGKYAQCGQLGNTWKNFDSALDSIVVSNETTGKMKKTEQNSYQNGILLTTGGTEQSKVMNIYDIAGNVYEWTLEKTPNTYEPCVTRGGLFNDTGSYRPAAEHGGSSSGHSFYSIGFRVSIF
ncbi:MAG: hypothetical protein DBY41_05380 [Clostridium sp.]|nr:MAG: hypothetical protein DBY41_05380 [Clostridium sp.]